jgi:hypothetical protein
MHVMVQPMGVSHIEGYCQHPTTLGEFQQSPSTYVKAALTKVDQLMQQPLIRCCITSEHTCGWYDLPSHFQMVTSQRQ